MNFLKKISLLIKEQQAQAMTEYIIVTGAILGMFAVLNGPIPLIPLSINMFQQYIDSMHMVITLPIP